MVVFCLGRWKFAAFYIPLPCACSFNEMISRVKKLIIVDRRMCLFAATTVFIVLTKKSD